MSEAARDLRVGLCAECVHGRRIESDRGSEFWMCELSAEDSRFAKYPRLPVLKCEGFERLMEPQMNTDKHR